MSTEFRLTNQTFLVAIAAVIMSTLVASAADTSIVATHSSRSAPRTIDPNTGLPVPPVVWIDPDWKDPDQVLREVWYDAIPVEHIAEELRKQFNNAFDVLIPDAWHNPDNPAVTIDPRSATIKMQLRNVTASELFNAMNLMFEAENTPYRWELRMNGNRPTATLRVLPELLPVVATPPPPTRMVYFVGDLLGDEKPGGFRSMSIEQLVKTVSEIYQIGYGQAKGALQYHKDTQLLIVTGTSDQIDFVKQALSALRSKAQDYYRKPQPKDTDLKEKTQ